jgi:Xaa-Pro aminopeptidase
MQAPRIHGAAPVGTGSTQLGNSALAGARAPLAPASARSAERVALIEEACRVTDGAIAALRAALRPGMTEKEAQAIIDGHFKKNGFGNSFPTISVFGQGTTQVHGNPGDRKLQDNDIVMVDVGARYEGQDGPWCSDITRTLFVGQPTARQREVWTMVHEAQKAGLAMVRPGVSASAIDKAARDYLRSRGFSIPHAVGHGVGRKVHESPIIDGSNGQKLKVGDVITVEPGVYLSKDGFGVRVEDTLVVTETGYRLLSHAPYA